MGKFVDLIGQTFGEWTVLSYAGVKGKNGYWLCRCSCGKEQEVRGAHIYGAVKQKVVVIIKTFLLGVNLAG